MNSNEVIQLNKELESAAKNGTDKLEVYEKFAEISQKNREDAVAKSCSGNPFCASGVLAEAEAGTDVATSLWRLPIFSSLSSDDLSQLDRFVLAENEESARAIYQSLPEYVKVALYTKEAGETIGFGAAVGGKGLSALGVIGKGGKGSPLPTSNPTIASNGLVYKSNPKHTLGQPSNRPNAGIEPQNSLKLFEQSIPSSKQYPNKEVRFAVDNKGNIHRFVGTNGEFHWNGSSGDGKNQLTSKQVPSDI
nr:hypothetical protein [Rosenbergiella nectarea]